MIGIAMVLLEVHAGPEMTKERSFERNGMVRRDAGHALNPESGY